MKVAEKTVLLRQNSETELPGKGKFLIKAGGRPGIPFRVQLTQTEYKINDTNQLWHEQSRVGGDNG